MDRLLRRTAIAALVAGGLPLAASAAPPNIDMGPGSGGSSPPTTAAAAPTQRPGIEAAAPSRPRRPLRRIGRATPPRVDAALADAITDRLNREELTQARPGEPPAAPAPAYGSSYPPPGYQGPGYPPPGYAGPSYSPPGYQGRGYPPRAYARPGYPPPYPPGD
jgi:hypothetical protein